MANKVRRDKLDGVCKSLIDGKSYRQALLDNGYNKDTANQGVKVKVIQEALDKNRQDLARKGMTAERAMLNLIWCQEENKTNYLLSKDKTRLQWMRELQSSNQTIAKHTLTTTTEEIGNLPPPAIIDNIINIDKTSDSNRL